MTCTLLAAALTAAVLAQTPAPDSTGRRPPVPKGGGPRAEPPGLVPPVPQGGGPSIDSPGVSPPPPQGSAPGTGARKAPMGAVTTALSRTPPAVRATALQQDFERSATRRLDLTRRALTAMNANDLATWRGAVADDHVWSPLDGDRRERLEGRVGLAGALAGPRQAIPDLKLVPRRVLVGKHFIALQTVTAGTHSAARRRVGAHSFVLAWTRGDEITTTVAYLAPDRIGRQVRDAKEEPIVAPAAEPEVVRAKLGLRLPAAALAQLEEATRFVAGLYVAAAGGDPDAQRYLLTPQAYPPPATLAATSRKALEKITDFGLEAEEVLPVQDHVVLVVRMGGTSGGRPIDARSAIVTTAARGRIAELQFYGNVEKLRTQLRP